MTIRPHDHAVTEPAAALPGLRRPRGGDRAGASMVEFAVVAPLLFFIILGIFELGRAIMVVELLTAGARVGCRTGMLPGKGSADVTTATNNFLASVGITGDVASVYVNDVLDPGGVNDPLSNAIPGTEVTVKVVVTVDKITWVPGGVYPTGSLTGQFTMRRQ